MKAEAAQETGTAVYGQPLLPQPWYPEPPSPQYVIVLPPYHPFGLRPLRLSNGRRLCCFAGVLVFLAAVAITFVFWPSDPEISITRLKLDHFNFRTNPEISLDITLDVKVKVRNRDFYSIEYESLMVAVGYRGKRLGFLNSHGGRIRARGSSYVDARLELKGVEVLSDAIWLIEDLAKGAIEFDTVSEIEGKIAVLSIGFPLKAKVACEITVNTNDKKITHQNCYPLF